jgi:adenylate cyclase
MTLSDSNVEPEWAMVTIVFVDIRGFTSFADRSTAREVLAYLQGFFDVVIAVVRAHGGRVMQLLGDGLFALFDAADHADRGLAAGVAMLAAVEARFGERCRIGVGMNSGLVLIGTIGAEGITELSVIGDPVNVAARVQAATRDVGEPLLLTEATRLLLERAPADLESRGALELKGKPAPTELYGLASVALSGRPGRTKEAG